MTGKKRIELQFQFIESKENLIVGSLDDFPLTLEQLTKIDANSDEVIHVFDGGLTAIVYQIKVGNQYYNLKKRREKILVQNPDGQTSFLNEVQRRRDFFYLKEKEPEQFKTIVETIYANYLEGIILSHWIDGKSITEFNEVMFHCLFSTLYEIDTHNLFEWDLCGGNLLVSQNQIYLFDFGYMYPFDVLSEYNPNGTKDGLFFFLERFETRFFIHYLNRFLETHTYQQMLELYRMEKTVGLVYLKKKQKFLLENFAEQQVIDWWKNVVEITEKGLESSESLLLLFHKDYFRSAVLEILDDVGGKSCTNQTIHMVDFVLEGIAKEYDKLKENGFFFFDDEKLEQRELLEKYNRLRKEVLSYQLFS